MSHGRGHNERGMELGVLKCAARSKTVSLSAHRYAVKVSYELGLKRVCSEYTV